MGISHDSPIGRLVGGVSLYSTILRDRISSPRLVFLKVFRRSVGSFISPMQTHYYASCMVTRLSTSLTHNSPTTDGIRAIVSLISKLVRLFQPTRITLWYLQLPPRPEGLPDLLRIKIFSFSYCGFSALRDNKSAESSITIAAMPLARDGAIQMKGMISDVATHKIFRKARSALCDEAVALPNALGNSLRTQYI